MQAVLVEVGMADTQLDFVCVEPETPAAAQAVKQARLLPEGTHELLALAGAQARWDLQALDRDVLVEAEVLAPVDDAEPPLADELPHGHATVERAAAPAEGIRFAHGS